ncbi:kinase-like domain-containing protein [Xylaria curta]|nr:kinase-like domain-containing protein [Xylaria curta]
MASPKPVNTAFATLTPANTLAKLAFSSVFEEIMEMRQSEKEDSVEAALQRMLIQPEKEYDEKIAYFRRGDVEGSITPYEEETDSEELPSKDLGMVWAGSYLISLDHEPADSVLGWTAGKGPDGNSPYDLLLCSRSFANEYSIVLANPHARFNFSRDKLSLYIMRSRSRLAQLKVGVEEVEHKPYHLNNTNMKISFDKLEYNFRWTDFARTDQFYENRRDYMNQFDGQSSAEAEFEMPTPLPKAITIDGWTLGRALGAGACGRVFLATNSSSDLAAIKMMERNEESYASVDREIDTIRSVTDLARRSDESERVMRMVDVIYPNGKEFLSSKTSFDLVYAVLRPMTTQTFYNLVLQSKREPKGMKREVAIAFRSALLGVKVMHDGGWVHCDLKPANIGFIQKALHSVLLDTGSSMQIKKGEVLEHRPGTVGTIGYLAPELEMRCWDHSIDIWSMGVILYQLTYPRHPWELKINPWREEYVEYRPRFMAAYREAIHKMDRDYRSACASPTEGYIHLGALFIGMVRFAEAPGNNKPRLNIDEVLQHPAWGSLLSTSSPQEKRQRVE